MYPSRRCRKAAKLLRFLVMLGTVFVACALPIIFPFHGEIDFDDVIIPAPQGLQARHVSAVEYIRPENITYETMIFTEEQLLRGKLLLLDQEHLLPRDVLPPNTASIAQYGNGMVPISFLHIKAGRETIDALKLLFTVLKEKEIEGLYVYQGTTTAAEQYGRLIKQMRQQMLKQSPDGARRIVLESAELPGTGELIQEYTVELRLIDGISRMADERKLEESTEGQALLQYAWRYGFVRCDPSHPYRFRYVGKAHATAMTYLNLSLAEYLEWLHQKRVIAISAGERIQYLIFCQPMENDRIAFELPAGAAYDASLDNTGYAVVACTL